MSQFGNRNIYSKLRRTSRLYLIQGSNEIYYQRIKLSKFHLNIDILIIKLFPEPCIDKVKEIYYSGLV